MFDLDEFARRIKGDNEGWKARDRAMREQSDRDENASERRMSGQVGGLGKALKLEPNGIYVIEYSYRLDQDQIAQMQATLKTQFPEMRFLVLDSDARIARDVTSTAALDEIVREQRLAPEKLPCQLPDWEPRYQREDKAPPPADTNRCTSGHRSKPLIDGDAGWESMRRFT